MLNTLYSRAKPILAALLPLFIVLSALGAVVMLALTFFWMQSSQTNARKPSIGTKKELENTED